MRPRVMWAALAPKSRHAIQAGTVFDRRTDVVRHLARLFRCTEGSLIAAGWRFVRVSVEVLP
jgi:hypothetical protein